MAPGRLADKVAIVTGAASSGEGVGTGKATAIQRHGKLDILVNNVGGGGRGTVVSVTEEDWDTAMDVNLKSMRTDELFSVTKPKRNIQFQHPLKMHDVFLISSMGIYANVYTLIQRHSHWPPSRFTFTPVFPLPLLG
jgi:NAD(P)-dependent dehydrogenase (short-subunit alcohol dehydrogenase family)